MRNLLIGILLAGSAITPALAQDNNGDNRSHRDQQQAKGDAHQQRQQAPRPQPQDARGPRGNAGNYYRPQQGPQGVAQQQQQQAPVEGGWGRGRPQGAANVAPQGGAQQEANGYRGRFQGQQNRNGGWTQGARYGEGQAVQQQGRGGFYGQRGAVQQQYRGANRYAGGSWNRDWRQDNRYDWRRYRESHRSVFRLGVYVDPFGYGYQPFGIGYRLPPIYFGQQYWIDPQMFDLPYPPPGTQWVRYWNDALLVDVYSGNVVDVIQGFFW